MKDILRNIIGYVLVGLFFNIVILYFYDGNFVEWMIIVEGTTLFTIIAVIHERLMMLMYLRYRAPVYFRIPFAVGLGLGLFTWVVWMTKPWLLVEIYGMPIFLFTILPMFVIGAVIFEMYLKKQKRDYNERLRRFKASRNS